jgi:hypothetical protein
MGCCKKKEVEFASSDTGGNNRRRRSNKNAPECNGVQDWPNTKRFVCVDLGESTNTPTDTTPNTTTTGITTTTTTRITSTTTTTMTTTTTTMTSSTIPMDPLLPPFWFDEVTQRLVILAGIAAPAVRRLVTTRGVAIRVGAAGGVGDLTLRGLQFFGTRFTTDTPSDVHQPNHDLSIEQCGFLFAPGRVELITTRRNGRGAGKRISVTNSSFEFGLGAMRYKATDADILGNYFAFNSFSRGGAMATVENAAMRSRFEENTLLYNGDGGAHNSWAKENVMRRNLIVGSSWLRRWIDTAVFHAVVPGQDGLLVEENWMLGPSNVKAVRLDTSKTTTIGGAGRYSTIRSNVFFGTDATTIKGVNHTVEHNTGDNLNMVKAWAQISEMNSHSYTRYNAMTRIYARGSNIVPGYAAANVCQDSSVCNPPVEEWLSPRWLAEQFEGRNLNDSVCDHLQTCWENMQVTMGEGGQAGVTTLPVTDRYGLGDQEPHEVPVVPLEQIEGLDFRPTPGSKLAWEVPAAERVGGTSDPQSMADSFIDGYTNELIQPSTFDTFAGAYAPNGRQWVPGCGGKPSLYEVSPLDAI